MCRTTAGDQPVVPEAASFDCAPFRRDSASPPIARSSPASPRQACSTRPERRQATPHAVPAIAAHEPPGPPGSALPRAFLEPMAATPQWSCQVWQSPRHPPRRPLRSDQADQVRIGPLPAIAPAPRPAAPTPQGAKLIFPIGTTIRPEVHPPRPADHGASRLKLTPQQPVPVPRQRILPAPVAWSYRVGSKASLRADCPRHVRR